MPIYEYRCAACGHEFEALQKLSDAALTTCPACQKSELKKLLSAAGFHLKGSGWYVTDFRNSGSKPPVKEKSAGGDVAAGGNGSAAAPAPGSSATGDAAKGETKATESTTAGTPSESKPAAATPSTTKSDA